ncbi:hypothetical protein BC938DRAFT_484275 [Jimgerdemannia flammicorona]|uniref:Uncharacterized protein n=1 Tax=Jimgerdemannia flammicorona TaxID=994334 RepID=A0A433QA62_9FUNG|nr:hypothetical protein BC938DRAFT_484275 [Jimgerdemannia flammicorona]
MEGVRHARRPPSSMKNIDVTRKSRGRHPRLEFDMRYGLQSILAVDRAFQYGAGVQATNNTLARSKLLYCYTFSVDPFTRKDWYDIKAPSMFDVRQVGKTLVNRTQGLSKHR